MYLYRHLLDKLGSFGSANLHLTPVLKELPTDENSTGEEVGVWLIKCTEGFLWLSSKLATQLFPHLQRDAEIPLFLLYFQSLLLWGDD